MRVVLFGHSKWATLCLRAMLEAGHEVLAVVTETDAYEATQTEVNRRFAEAGAYESLKEVALFLDLPVRQPEDPHVPEVIQWLVNLDPEMLVVVSYHSIFKTPLLDRFRGRIINAHLAPLPYYRGRAPVNWAIINGEDHTAVTVHFIDPGIDTGPILLQERVPIGPEDRAIDVLLRALPIFPTLVCQALEQVSQGRVVTRPQNPFDGSYFPRRTPADGAILWTLEHTTDIHNKIRALAYPYPGAFAITDSGKVVTFERSRRSSRDTIRISPVPAIVFGQDADGAVQITTLDGFISICEIRDGTRVVPAGELLRPGTRFRIQTKADAYG